MKSLQYYWYHPNGFVWFLLPLSWLYCFVVYTRKALYQLNIKKSFDAKAPVVVIGNIVVGGSGKTPLLIALCKYLQEKGYKPGVVSRGYGGSVDGVKSVLSTDSASLVGDEPLMISLRTQVPVVVGADRVAAVNYLLDNNACDIVLSDDGLQHYRMQRDLELAVIDANRKFGNGFCLPAGPLRERVSRLDDVDIVVYNGAIESVAGECGYELKIVGVSKLNSQADAGEGREELLPLTSFAGRKIHAVAGIGNPLRFFTQLGETVTTVTEHAFPDHHIYTQDDFSGWNQDCIIMTEKDAVKCRHLNLKDAWVLLVKAEISDALTRQLEEKLLPLLDRKAS